MNSAVKQALVERLLREDRCASEAADAREPKAVPLPALTAEQCAAMDEAGELCDA